MGLLNVHTQHHHRGNGEARSEGGEKSKDTSLKDRNKATLPTKTTKTKRIRWGVLFIGVVATLTYRQWDGQRSKRLPRLERKIDLEAIADNIQETNTSSTDIAFVFTVHGALDYFRLALDSLNRHTRPRWGRMHVFVADDCGNQSESKQLKQMMNERSLPSTVIAMGLQIRGYTRSVNAGLRYAIQEGFDVIVVLNSDLVFGPFWLEPLVAALAWDTSIGVVGPVGNAASYQSVPELTNPSGGWSLNPLPPGWTVKRMSNLAQMISHQELVSVPILNGFAMAFHRRVFEAVGLMDEALFPVGYGEENEFAFRATQAGFKLVVQPSSFIFHHKTKSFTAEERQEFGEAAKKVIQERMGPQLKEAVNLLTSCGPLAKNREKFAHHLRSMLPAVRKRFSVLFLLNIMPKPKPFVLRGGWISIVQEAIGLALAGAYVRIAVQDWAVLHFKRAFPKVEKGMFVGFQAITPGDVATELEQRYMAFNFFVATHSSTVETALQLCKRYPRSVKAYYVQDVETGFENLQSMAYQSYANMSDGFVFVKTNYLKKRLRREFSIRAHLIPPTVNANLFLPNTTGGSLTRIKETKPHVCAMVRTLTPRRQPVETIRVLLTALDTLGLDRMRVTVTGTTTEEVLRLIRAYPSLQPFMGEMRILGFLDRDSIAQLYQSCTFLLDFSSWQAFGRSGLEAMTAGCVPILPITGGASTYAVHGVNALLINTSQISYGVKALVDLVKGRYNVPAMRRAAIETGKKYDIQLSSRLTGSIFQRFLSRWQLKEAMKSDFRIHQCTASSES